MATTVTASNFTALLLPCAGQLIKPTSTKLQSLPSQLGRVATNGGSCIRCCSLEKRGSSGAVDSIPKKAASLMAVAAAAVSANVGPAMALVDERMSTEGTGLPFGLSNNLLGWILLGVFGLIWSFYTVYTSSLDEDEESGLSL